MKSRKVVIVGLILGLFVAGVALAEQAKVPNTGITIEVLPSWSVDTSGGRGNLITIKDKPLQGFSAMINLVAEDIYGKAPDQWLTEYKTNLGTAVKELAIIKQGPVKLGGVDYLAIEFRGMQGKAMLHWMQVIHIQEGKAWIFTGTSLERYANIYMPKFQKAFSSIYFPPPPPADFVAATASPTSIQLKWKDVSVEETGFVIQRRDASTGSWADIATVPSHTTAYTDQTGLTCKTDYHYRIKTLNPRGDSNWSGEIAGSTAPCPEPVPGAPGGTPPPSPVPEPTR